MRRLAGLAALVLAFAGAPALAQGSFPPAHLPPPPPVPGSPPAPAPELQFAGSASEDLATNLAFLGTLIPASAGGVAWALRGESNTVSEGLIWLGVIEGPALGYHYAGLHRTSAVGESIRGGVAVATIVVELGRSRRRDRDGVLAAGAGLDLALALYDAAKLRERMGESARAARLEARPVLLARGRVPGLALSARF